MSTHKHRVRHHPSGVELGVGSEGANLKVLSILTLLICSEWHLCACPREERRLENLPRVFFHMEWLLYPLDTCSSFLLWPVLRKYLPSISNLFNLPLLPQVHGTNLLSASPVTCIIVIYVHTNIYVCLGCEYLSDQTGVLLVFLFLVGWIKWMLNLSYKTVNNLRQDYWSFCLFILHVIPQNSLDFVVTQ